MDKGRKYGNQGIGDSVGNGVEDKDILHEKYDGDTIEGIESLNKGPAFYARPC